MKYHSHLVRIILVLTVLAAGWYGCSENPVSSGKTPVPKIGDSHVYIGPAQGDSPVTFNFGYAPQDSKITHIFWLHNRSYEPLEIISVRPG